jgi:hypothetical protein
MAEEMTTADLLFIFRERAAIIEFDGKHSREHAEYLAAKCVRAMIAPEPLPDEILAVLAEKNCEIY